MGGPFSGILGSRAVGGRASRYGPVDACCSRVWGSEFEGRLARAGLVGTDVRGRPRNGSAGVERWIVSARRKEQTESNPVSHRVGHGGGTVSGGPGIRRSFAAGLHRRGKRSGFRSSGTAVCNRPL